MGTSPALSRALGLVDSVAIGVGAMVGAGVFAVWPSAAASAGSWLPLALLLAALVAFCNATSTAQLAAVHPVAGGAYAYGRAELGSWWGFLAGWCFVVGKTASCAAMALVFAAYVAPPGFERPFAIAAVIVLTGVNLLGVTRTALATKIIVAAVLACLAVAAVASFSAPPATPSAVLDSTPHGVLQAAGLLFFAFAGYARIATMGEEVRDPARTITRAIPIALVIALVVYAVVGLGLLRALGTIGLAESSAPLADAVEAAGWEWAQPAVRTGAALAALGALLALFAGIGRTAFAMAREKDLPGVLAAVHPRTRVPYRAETAVALIVVALVATVDLRGAIGVSSFGVLAYYLVANFAASRQNATVRRYPRALQAAGMAGCVALATALPWHSIVGGASVIAVGVVLRASRLVRERRRIVTD